jgi:hypothetical protein
MIDFRSGRAGLFFSKQWFAAESVALSLFSLLWILWFWPTPFSDFFLYWDEAGGTAAYERGGAGVLVFALVRRFLSAPQWAALFVNLSAAVFLLWLFWRCDTTRWRVFAHLGALYLLLITPYFGLVQIDLIATAWLAVCWALLLRPPLGWPRWLSWGLGLSLGVAAVSTRPQFALTMSVLVGMLVVLWLMLDSRRGTKVLLTLSATLALVVAIGFSLDLCARYAAGTGERVRTSSAVTLYSGLLATEAGSWCGGWTPAASQAALEDRDKPLSVAMSERLAARPAEHWLGIVQCKLARVVLLPRPFALFWLAPPGTDAASLDAEQRRRLDVVEALRPWERALYRLLTLAIYLGGVVVAILKRHMGGLALLPIAWASSFWLVHLVFEAQERYFLATIALLPLLPLLSALVSSADAPRRIETRASAS